MQYFCLGFKDRELEDEYLDDLARLSTDRLCLGYVVAFVGKNSRWLPAAWSVAYRTTLSLPLCHRSSFNQSKSISVHTEC